MKISKEHILALKISILLLIFGFIITYFLPYINHSNLFNFKQGSSRYFIFIILSILTYFISYILAKITIKPIEENNKKLKEYNHNLAHEIKTPLSVLKTNIELLELKRDKKLLISSKEEILEMEKIIDGLLFLSESNSLINLEKVSFKSLLNKYLDKDINLNIKQDLIVLGNENLLDRLLKNLVENARKYSIGKSKINIFLDKDSFIIENDFDGNIKNPERLFEAFYQADNSRSISGYGLGLSIVSKILNLHKLKKEIKINDNKFIFEIYL